MSDERLSAIIASCVNELAEEITDSYKTTLDDFSRASPIEQLLAAGFSFCLRSACHYRSYNGWLCPASDDNDLEFYSYDRGPASISIIHQMPIGKYTADFFAVFHHRNGGISMGIIECDGHNFHEKTKKQAVHDKTRDRYIQGRGYLVLRYTGSEIYADPVRCAADALSVLKMRAESDAKVPA